MISSTISCFDFRPLCSRRFASEKPRKVDELSLSLPPSLRLSNLYDNILLFFPEKNVFLSSFVTSPEGHAPALKDVSVLAMQAHTVRHTQNVVKRTLLVTKLHEEWRTYTRYVWAVAK